MREPFWWPMNEPPLPTDPVPNWELFDHVPVSIETPWELEDD